MRAGRGSSDAYLADWRRSDARPCSDDLQAEAAAEAARIEQRYTDEDLERLIRSKGIDQQPGDGQRRCQRDTLMYAVRQWSVRHARGLNNFYRRFERMLVRMDGLFRALGYERVERPVAAVEKGVKGFLFDCRMCGQCVLSSTGMACPMNCPKTLRNGPCGGVRADGNCEVKPEMKCVWVEAVARQPAHPRRGRGAAHVAVCGRSSAAGPLLVAARRARAERAAVKFEDEPVPGYPLPILPGHTSPGRFERVLRAGGFAVTTELAPPDSADPEEVLRSRPRVRRLRRCHQRHRRQRRQLPHVERCGLRAADPRAATRRSCRSPAATRTASPSRATSSAAPPWASATSCA